MGDHSDIDHTGLTGVSGIPATIVDAKGDLIAATAADTVARLAVGTNGQVLTAASGQSTGLQWATPSAGASHLWCRKTADEAFSSTSYADSANMTLALEASKVYKVRFVIFFTTNATTVGIKLAIQGPASCAATFGNFLGAAAPAGGGAAIHHNVGISADISTDLEFASATTGPGTSQTIAILEGLVVNSTNAGNLKLRHASETATATTILNRSHGELWEIA